MNPVLKVLADDNMPGVAECLSHLSTIKTVKIQYFSGRQLAPSDLTACDWLFVRSVTTVNAALLAKHKPCFIGTATIGIDHLDTDFLNANQIAWSAAPGCNALAVGQWAITVMMNLLALSGKKTSQTQLGVVGLGHVGTAVARLASACGFTVVGYDPWLTQHPVRLQTLEQLLAESNVVSLHTPLTRQGEFPTYHLFNQQTLAQMKPSAWLINAGRGDVIDQQALIDALAQKKIAGAVLDVWPNEPAISPQLVDLVTLASPHIAGHSLEGKWRGTWQIVAAACEKMQLPPPPPLASLLPSQGVKQLNMLLSLENYDNTKRMMDLLQQCIDVLGDDTRIRQAVLTADPAAAFDQLRRQYEVRREFESHHLLINKDDSLYQVLCNLGFRC